MCSTEHLGAETGRRYERVDRSDAGAGGTPPARVSTAPHLALGFLIYTRHRGDQNISKVAFKYFSGCAKYLAEYLLIFCPILSFHFMHTSDISILNQIFIFSPSPTPAAQFELSSHVWVGWKVWQEVELQPFFLLKADNFIHSSITITQPLPAQQITVLATPFRRHECCCCPGLLIQIFL